MAMNHWQSTFNDVFYVVTTEFRIDVEGEAVSEVRSWWQRNR